MSGEPGHRSSRLHIELRRHAPGKGDFRIGILPVVGPWGFRVRLRVQDAVGFRNFGACFSNFLLQQAGTRSKAPRPVSAGLWKPAQGPRHKALELVCGASENYGVLRTRVLLLKVIYLRAVVLHFLNTHLACEIRPRLLSVSLACRLSTTTSGWAYLRCARKFWPTAADTKDMGTSERSADLSIRLAPLHLYNPP